MRNGPGIRAGSTSEIRDHSAKRKLRPLEGRELGTATEGVISRANAHMCQGVSLPFQLHGSPCPQSTLI